MHGRYLMVLASAQLRARPERKDGGHPALCNAPPQWLRMRHQSHQSGTKSKRRLDSRLCRGRWERRQRPCMHHQRMDAHAEVKRFNHASRARMLEHDAGHAPHVMQPHPKVQLQDPPIHWCRKTRASSRRRPFQAHAAAWRRPRQTAHPRFQTRV